MGVNLLVMASTLHSSVSSAIFCVSMTSPAMRISLGAKHNPSIILPREFLVDIHRSAVTDAVSFAALPANNIKIPMGVYIEPIVQATAIPLAVIARVFAWVQPASR